jgi:aspartyl-tRNA(Asn)/glutamyl-tRNA(Gln) amidotransferase subunit A
VTGVWFEIRIGVRIADKWTGEIRMGRMDIANASLAELITALRAGTLSAGDLADWAIDNHDTRGEAFHAYKTWDQGRLRAQAVAADAAFAAGIDLGALQGIPVSIKDLVGVSGYPTYAGCPRELSENWQTEGPVVTAIRHQLGVVSGKTHTVQFAFGGLGVNPHWGPPRNPWDAQDHRSPGGSSSGAGVSLHEGSALLAIGTDTAGSVRMPATMTGNAGFRPTPGRWSTDGIVPLVKSLDTAGPLARSVDDLVIGFGAIDPRVDEDAVVFRDRLFQAELGDFRVGICDWYFKDCDPGISETVMAALDELSKAGLRTEVVKMPHFDDVTDLFSAGGLHVGEFSAFIKDEMRDFEADLDPAVAIRLAKAESDTAAEHLNRVKAVTRMARVVDDAYGGLHAIIGPTIPLTPPRMIDIADPESHFVANMRLVRNTNTASLLKLCAMTVPVGLDAEDMPVGMQIVSRENHDETALALALACERVLGTSRDRLGVPTMCR